MWGPVVLPLWGTFLNGNKTLSTDSASAASVTRPPLDRMSPYSAHTTTLSGNSVSHSHRLGPTGTSIVSDYSGGNICGNHNAPGLCSADMTSNVHGHDSSRTVGTAAPGPGPGPVLPSLRNQMLMSALPPPPSGAPTHLNDPLRNATRSRAGPGYSGHNPLGGGNSSGNNSGMILPDSDGVSYYARQKAEREARDATIQYVPESGAEYRLQC
jgi:hypothetical protein